MERSGAEDAAVGHSKAAVPERFPALALSRSGSKGISHPRGTGDSTGDADSKSRCAAQDPRVSSRHDTPHRGALTTIPKTAASRRAVPA
jgi:hypothetical protein